ncbi:MAG: hypothetical protein ACRDA0_08355 [Cetobacterium sp.]|uniref:hypothetical protein n=1 Tax=Cetobacterium sp. TaxID=2071632 RepID=UPI003F32F386
MAIRTLGIDIMSYLKGDGFNAADKQVGVLKGSLNGLKGIASSSLGQLAVGYLGVNKLITEYGKAIEASNYQIEQETKLYSTMKGQGFRDEQIESIKKYASELQDLGVVGDEVTLAGTQQLATYNLTEQSLKKLMPAMQDIIVQQKGINATGGDAVGAANMLAKGLLGQTGELKQAGITLNERQEKLIKVGTQEQKVAALVEAVTMNVGEQNKAFLNTPEGKIKNSQNAIGDLYERMGAMFRESRAETYEFFGNNIAVIERFLKNIVQSVLGTTKAITRVGTQMYKVFSSLPPEVQNTLKILGGFFAITHFPIAAGVLLIEDLFTAFEGGDSLIQQSFDKLMEFVGIDLTFNGAVDDIKELWKSFEEANGVAITLEVLKGMIDALTTSLGILGDAGKTVAGALGLVGNTGKNIWKLATNEDYTFDDVKKDMSESWDDGSGKMFRDGFMGNVNRSMEFLDRTVKKSGEIKKLYDDGQKNLGAKKQIENIPIPQEKRGIEAIEKLELKIKLPTLAEKKPVDLKYQGGDVNVHITGVSDSGMLEKIRSEIKKDRLEEERVLKQMIGGEMINA